MENRFHTENIFRPTYTQGLALFFYGLIWLGITLAGYLAIDRLFGTGNGWGVNLIIATIAAGLAGGTGGVAAMLNRLEQHVAVQQNILQQSILLYIAQPVAGVIVGISVLYLIVLPANLIINFAGHREFILLSGFSSATFMASAMLLAWVAGFYQQQGLKKLKVLLKLADSDSGAKKFTPNDINVIDEDDPFAFKQWYRYQQNMVRWSYTWGIFILAYGIIWVAGLIISYLMVGQLAIAESENGVIATALVLTAWPAAMAGGIGGAAGMLNTLYRHISIKQDFNRQHLMLYLVQPVVGCILGVAIYFFVTAGYLVISPAITPPTVSDRPALIMIQMVLGWIAGFRHQTISDLILKLIRDIVDFFKLVGNLINPATLIDQTKREKALAELNKKTEVFKPVAENPSQSDDLRWWVSD